MPMEKRRYIWETNTVVNPMKFVLSALYILCNFPIQQIHDGLNKWLMITDNFDGLLSGGDLNSKRTAWGESMRNCNGKTLNKWLLDNCTEITRICDSNYSIPNGSSLKISTLPTFSDHFPLKIDIWLDVSNLMLRTPRFFTSYKSTAWQLFRSQLDSAVQQIMPPINRYLINAEINNYIRNFTNTFETVHKAH